MPPPISSSSVAKDPLVGTVVAGRYRVIARLGQGGMSVTYRAWDMEASRPVVLKHPKPEMLASPGFLERFSRETRMMAAFSHPNVAPITTVGEHDGIPYLVMPFLPGGSLANRRLRDESGEPQPMHPSTLHLWLPQVAAALDYVHSQGVVHRDVKPGNVFFDCFWHAFLGDFGISKIVEETESLDREHTLTATSVAVGTHGYMAPELFAPKPVLDGRVDQYALAVMVYEMLAGRRPFTGDTAHLIVEVTTKNVPPLRGFRRDLPRSLEEAVDQSLAKHSGDRFGSCLEFIEHALADVPPMQDEPGLARLLCPACENLLKLPTTAAGEKGRCPRCKNKMEVAADLSAFWLTSEERGTESTTAKQSLTPLDQPLTQVSAVTTRRWGMVALATCCGLVLGYAGGTVSQQAKMQAELQRLESQRHKELLAAKDSLAKAVDKNAELQRMLATRDAELEAAVTVANSADIIATSKVQQPKEEKTEVAETNLPPVKSPQAAPVAMPELPDVAVGAAAAHKPTVAPAVNTLLTGRDAGRKKVLLGAAGGSSKTERAVAMALEWLKKQQSQKDGLWSLTGPYDDGGSQENELAATVMSLLAFQGAGNTMTEGPHHTVVARAWRSLLKAQQEDGSFDIGQLPMQHALYSHAQATMALCELHGMSRDPKLAEPAARAVAYCVAAQGPNGGWRYEPGKPGDMSVTGWYMMALKTAEMAGMEVPAATFEGIGEFLDTVANDNGSRYGYRRDSALKPAGPVTAAVTAEGLLCRQYLGWKQRDPRLVEGLELLMAENRLDFESDSEDVYAWYHITQVAHHMEGDHWQRWNERLREVLPRGQLANGKQKGSWDPARDKWGTRGGRLFVTSFCTYMLEVYYRHLPLYTGLPPDPP